MANSALIIRHSSFSSVAVEEPLRRGELAEALLAVAGHTLPIAGGLALFGMAAVLAGAGISAFRRR